jgi:hypothetical protein
MYVAHTSPFFARLYLIQKNPRALETSAGLPDPFDLATEALLVAAPGTSVHRIRQQAIFDASFDPHNHAIRAVQWVGHAQAMLCATVAVCSVPWARPDGESVLYGPFVSPDVAEEWLAKHFPGLCEAAHTLYPIPNALALSGSAWKAEMGALLEARLDEYPVSFSGPKQAMQPKDKRQLCHLRRVSIEPSFAPLPTANRQSGVHLVRTAEEQENYLQRLLEMIEPSRHMEARRILIDLVRGFSQDK